MNKEHEQIAFELVYSNFAGIIRIGGVDYVEPPDFLCTNKDGSIFGVEVTELHLSETQARLTHKPYYADSLIKHGRHFDKADKAKLFDEELVIMSGPSAGEKLQGVHNIEERNIDVYCKRLKEAVEAKIEKVDEYKKKSPVVDLIVWDVDNLTGFTPTLKLLEVMRILGFESTLTHSGFREIYLLFRLNNYAIYVPLLETIRQIYLPNGSPSMGMTSYECDPLQIENYWLGIREAVKLENSKEVCSIYSKMVLELLHQKGIKATYRITEPYFIDENDNKTVEQMEAQCKKCIVGKLINGIIMGHVVVVAGNTLIDLMPVEIMCQQNKGSKIIEMCKRSPQVIVTKINNDKEPVYLVKNGIVFFYKFHTETEYLTHHDFKDESWTEAAKRISKKIEGKPLLFY